MQGQVKKPATASGSGLSCDAWRQFAQGNGALRIGNWEISHYRARDTAQFPFFDFQFQWASLGCCLDSRRLPKPDAVSIARFTLPFVRPKLSWNVNELRLAARPLVEGIWLGLSRLR